MSFEVGHLFFAGVVYLLLLFLIAYATEQGWIPERITRHPLTYTLSLGVYATTWSFYGSVGFAQSQGFNFLSIYLGVTLAFILVPVLLAPLLRIARDYQLTSLADLLSFRYQSQFAGILVTLFMLAGTFPYIALQILAVTESIEILTQEFTPQLLALGFCVTLTLFAILFGARHISPREKHDGLVVAIAFESLVKLFALCAVGLYATFGVFGGLGGVDAWLNAHPEALEALYRPVREGPWATLILLSFGAAFLLPRQFHMGFTENIEERTLFSAAWAFPLYLLLLNLFIPVILWAGIETQPGTRADFYVLGVTFNSGFRPLTVLAFLGGLSAASAMMIVTTVALSSMCLNHLVLPASYPDPDVNLYKRLLWGRRTLIAVIILAGYGFYLVLEKNQGLVQLGLISFVAVAQFLPGIGGLLYWPRATRAGFISGLIGGGGVWCLTLLLPLLESSGILPAPLAWLSLPAPAGIDQWSYATFATLAVNGSLFIGVSLLTRPTRAERDAADACRQTSFVLPIGVVLDADSPEDFEHRLSRILGKTAAEYEVRQALRDLSMPADERRPDELGKLRERIERNLSGLMGPMLSRMIVDERLEMDSSARLALADNVRFIEERLERSQTRLEGVAAELDGLRRYHQQILRDLPLGACALGSNGEIVSWNVAMEMLVGVPRRTALGTPIEQLPEPWSQLIRHCVDADDRHIHKRRALIDGRARWFNLHKAAIDDPAAPRGAGGMVVLVEDLTDVHTLESEVAHSERLALIGRLAAGVAHEIGNPVTGIACLAQNLESETSDRDTRATSREIVEQTRRISDIVQTLVAFSHGGAVSGDTRSAVNVHACVQESLRLVRLGHEGKQMQYHNECAGDLEISADRTRMQQVFVNLLNNACDASRPGDSVVVTAQARNGRTVIEIVDQGEGIPADILESVFEPFVTTKAPGSGTGLGLPVVYRIVQEHDGTIRLASEPGRGTRVTLSFPTLVRAQAPDSSDGQTPSPEYS